ncbi:unnamed protein product [Sympodiomycopsis kandeliae]
MDLSVVLSSSTLVTPNLPYPSKLDVIRFPRYLELIVSTTMMVTLSTAFPLSTWCEYCSIRHSDAVSRISAVARRQCRLSLLVSSWLQREKTRPT